MDSSNTHSAQLHQAEGIVSVQADCTTDEAFIKISERAKALGLTLEDTAAEVLSHRIWFRPPRV